MMKRLFVVLLIVSLLCGVLATPKKQKSAKDASKWAKSKDHSKGKSKTPSKTVCATDADADYSSLADALAAAVKPVEFRLCPGTYSGDYLVKTDGVIISGAPEGNSTFSNQVRVNASHVTIRHVNFHNTDPLVNEDTQYGIVVDVLGDFFTLTHNRFNVTRPTGSDPIGIAVRFNGNTAVISRNEFYTDQAHYNAKAVYIGNRRTADAGINVTNVVVVENIMVGWGSAVYSTVAADSVIDRVVIVQNYVSVANGGNPFGLGAKNPADADSFQSNIEIVRNYVYALPDPTRSPWGVNIGAPIKGLKIAENEFILNDNLAATVAVAFSAGPTRSNVEIVNNIFYVTSGLLGTWGDASIVTIVENLTIQGNTIVNNGTRGVIGGIEVDGDNSITTVVNFRFGNNQVYQPAGTQLFQLTIFQGIYDSPANSVFLYEAAPAAVVHDVAVPPQGPMPFVRQEVMTAESGSFKGLIFGGAVAAIAGLVGAAVYRYKKTKSAEYQLLI